MRVKHAVLGALFLCVAVAAFLFGRRLRRPGAGESPNSAEEIPSHGAELSDAHGSQMAVAGPPRPMHSEASEVRWASGPPQGQLRMFPRDPDEWQGMPVDLSVQASCETSSLCGLAAACVGGHCGPCVRDGECAEGEICVLDHCLLKDKVGCRSKRRCASGEFCVLSGFSHDPRGNRAMSAHCLNPWSGLPKTPVALSSGAAPSSPPPLNERLLEELRQQQSR
jgi:hypothetical protein